MTFQIFTKLALFVKIFFLSICCNQLIVVENFFHYD